MVLTLVIVTDEAAQYDAVRAASEAAREHPCRVLAVITRRPEADSRLDAEIRVGESAPGEVVLLRMYGAAGRARRLGGHPAAGAGHPGGDLVARDSPGRPGRHPLGALAQRRITDAAAAAAPHDCLASLAAHYQPGDTDLSWTRATPWRSLLAATLDQPHGAISGGRVEAERGNPTADLIAAWLSVRLGAPFENRVSGGPGVTAVIFDTSDGEIDADPPGRPRWRCCAGPASRTGRVALHRRDTAELLAEELRRLDPDEVYAETIAPFVPAQRRGAAERRQQPQAGHGQPRTRPAKTERGEHA